MENNFNHQAQTIIEACGIDRATFESKLKNWANETTAKGYKGSQTVESLEDSFTKKELALLVYKSIEELNAVQQFIPKQ